LKVEWSDEIEEEFLIGAWRDAMRRAWDEPSTSRQRRTDLTTSAKVLAEQRGSKKVIQELRSSNPDMDPEQAFRVLEVPNDVDEGMLLMVYQLRVRGHMSILSLS
jgi:ubiquitin carboxyl-terminal hydrolase 25/28